MLNKDFNSHFENDCPKMKKKCEKCELEYFIRREGGEPHDCFKELLQASKGSKKELEKLEFTLGIDYKKINVTCPKGKQMVAWRGNVPRYQ